MSRARVAAIGALPARASRWVLVLAAALAAGCPKGDSPSPTGDFTVSVSPAQVSGALGGPSQAFRVAIGAEHGFAGLVSVDIGGLPSGATTSPPVPLSLAPGENRELAVDVPALAAVGVFDLRVIGTSGSTSHEAGVTLTVLPTIRTSATADMVYLETHTSTEVARIGLRRAWGDSITEVSLNGTNYVNSDDPGREVQTSLWDGNADYSGGVGPWNPVEAGDSLFDGSPVLEERLGVDDIYTRTQPLDWAPSLSGNSPPSLGDAYVEKWISVVPGENRAFRLHYKVTHFGSDAHANAMQEFPVVYANAPFSTYVAYEGDAPWTHGPLTRATLQSTCCEMRHTPEQWSALVDGSDSGLTVYVPGQLPATKGWSPGFVNSFTPIVAFSYDPGAVLESDVYVIAGPVERARAIIYALHQAPHDPSPFPPIGFDGPLNPGIVSGVAYRLSGWAYGTSPIADAAVYVDGARIGSATYGLARPDVPQVFPGFGSNTGYEFLLDSTGLSNGAHAIVVRVTDSTGKVTTLGTLHVVVTN